MGSAVAVEEVTGGKSLRRFVELPAVLHGDDPRFAWPVMAWERYRLDPHRNPFFEAGDGTYLLARRHGRPVGRITAHLARPGAEGCFGFWCCEDDPAVADALLDGARHWLTRQECTSMTGPVSFSAAEEEGLLVEGHDAPGLTGRPWHPASQARLLVAAGAVAVRDRPTWRLVPDESGPTRPTADDPPGHAGRHADPRLVLEGIAAVPDLAQALRGATLRRAWSLAQRARAGAWATATVVRLDDEPAQAVPALLTAAARAGYAAVVSPWSPDPAVAPEAVHRTFRLRW